MVTINSIKEDLREIKYYYSRKEVFEKALENVGENSIMKKIEKYNSLIKNAPPRLFDLYVSLYLTTQTQESLAEHLGFVPEYISMLNCRLIKFFLKELKKENNNDR